MNKWETAYMDTAIRFSQLSTAKKLQVGSIIVRENRIISIGYNGMPSGWDNVCENDTGMTKPEVVHAEANAIIKLARDGQSGFGADIYITHAPCIQCAKMIYGSGINRVFYLNEYRNQDGIIFLKKCDIFIEKVAQSL